MSFFTTPQDLRARILHDVPDLLKQMGAEVGAALNLSKDIGDEETLKRFSKLPKMFSGREVSIEFVNEGNFHSALPEACKALGLEIGATVTAYVTLTAGERFQVFAERNLAFGLCKLPKGEKVQARAITAFGAFNRVDWTDDGPVLTPDVETGLVVKRILGIDSSKE